MVLSDGRRLTLDRGLGFTSWPAATDGSAVTDPWRMLSEDTIKSNVVTTLLPDDDTDGDHRWTRFVELLDTVAIRATADQLRRVPYDIELGPRLRARLPPSDPAPEPPGR